MNASYTIRFADGADTITHEYKPRFSQVTNGLRASVAKLGDLSQITTDMSILNSFLALILDTTDDFTDALPEDTDAVVTDFFTLFSKKTS